jgi:hypothetical protein
MVLKRGIFGVKGTLSQFREELDEHLLAINENTGEIQTNYTYVQDLHNKLDQLAARLDRIETLLEGQPQRFSVQPLTYAEKQVFLVLYTEESPLTYGEIAQKTGFSDALVQQYTTNLIEKGIPIIKSYFNSTPFMKLNPQFKEAQAKGNLLNLSLQSFVDA